MVGAWLVGWVVSYEDQSVCTVEEERRSKKPLSRAVETQTPLL